MHDNPPAGSARNFALPDQHVISLTGRDAVAFAQAQFMNDVTALASGHWQWNGWLTPKGRVVALFALLRIDDETVWLLLPDADPVAMVDALQRFVFRSRVTLAVGTELKVSGAFVAPLVASAARLDASHPGALELDFSGQGGPRSLRIGTDAAGENEDGTLLARWLASDLQHGLPRLPSSQVEQWTPQQLSLERLRGFSIRKGCYPGQEIVARTHFLGKAKRGLALLEAHAPLAVGTPIHDGDTLLGNVICAAGAAARHLGLAVLPMARAAVALTASGSPVRELQICSGLDR